MSETTFIVNGEDIFAKIERLQAENELLKRLLSEKVKTLDKMTGIYSARLCKKYKQALEEIREIASPHCSQCIEILDKIDEVLK